jgi:tetratricopeptide (TPR) repeat protein
VTARARAWAFAALLTAAAAPAHAQNDAAQPAAAESQLVRAKRCFEAAQAAYAAGKLNEARESFACAFAIAPSPELAWNLARVYERTGEASRGIHFYTLYLESDSVKPDERADIERRLAALEALRDRQRAQVKGTLPAETELSDEARSLFFRGVKAYRGAQYDAALAAFTAALHESHAPELLYNAAITCERLHKPSDVLQYFRAYLAARPDADDRTDVAARITQLRQQLKQ